MLILLQAPADPMDSSHHLQMDGQIPLFDLNASSEDERGTYNDSCMSGEWFPTGLFCSLS